MYMYGVLVSQHTAGLPEGWAEVQRDDSMMIYNSDAEAACACSAEAYEFEGTRESGDAYRCWVVPLKDVEEFHPVYLVHRARERAIDGNYKGAIEDLRLTRDAPGHHISRVWHETYGILELAIRQAYAHNLDLAALWR